MVPAITGVHSGREYCSWQDICQAVKDLASKVDRRYDCMLAIANGGIIPARLLAEELDIDCIQVIPVRKKQLVNKDMPHLERGKRYLVVDDIYDTGDTYRKVSKALEGLDCDYAFCMSRRHQEFGAYGRLLGHEKWIVFPWEKS
jgi:hypoxanthine phosphoribosyltransferase